MNAHALCNRHSHLTSRMASGSVQPRIFNAYGQASLNERKEDHLTLKKFRSCSGTGCMFISAPCEDARSIIPPRTPMPRA
jgi:hypothetical protein